MDSRVVRVHGVISKCAVARPLHVDTGFAVRCCVASDVVATRRMQIDAVVVRVHCVIPDVVIARRRQIDAPPTVA